MDPTRLERARPRWYLEVPLLVGGYLVFGLVRARIDRGEPAATTNADAVQELERGLHVAVERSLNHALVDAPWAIYLTGYFYRLCLVAVPAVLLALFLSRSPLYRYLRTVLVVTTLLDLPLVWLFPEAPPRFALDGIVDYVSAHDIVGGAALRNPDAGLNLLAAMPSMHIAWTTWSAFAAWSALRSRHPRAAWLPWLLPAFTAYVVVATGHHYVLDVVGGVLLLAVAVGLTSLGYRRRSPAGTSVSLATTGS